MPAHRANFRSESYCAEQGKTLTISVKQIFTDFQTAAEKFQKLNYDAMNVEATQFVTDFANFCAVIRELERRLGAVIAQVKKLPKSSVTVMHSVVL